MMNPLDFIPSDVRFGILVVCAVIALVFVLVRTDP